ncbi:UvrD-helicase domain-containing protein [Demequina sp.]|uniref:UvrD-helicase domain-containing protein n=1 Tax=Demequina sp. TaxID=2050685 RepID=UPI003D12A134
MSEHGVVIGRSRSAAELMAAVSHGAAKLPTAEQSAVIEAGLEPTLVVAGAGSGKTETLSLRILYLLDHACELFGEDISPDEILCLTFTRKAAAEIAERSERYVALAFDERGPDGLMRDPERPAPAVATYNGYAAGLALEHGLRLGVDPDSTVLTNAALWQLASRVVEEWTDELDTDSALSVVASGIPSLAGQLRDHGVSPQRLRDDLTAMLTFFEALPKKAGQAAAGVMTKDVAGSIVNLRRLIALSHLVEDFQARKRAGSYLDFADQVAIACELAELPAVREAEASRYRAILLDEFQDTSPAQLTLFSRLYGGAPVMAVGDPNQAIYGFRGASAAALEAFVEAFGGRDRVRQASLSVSWRNDAAILDAANVAAAPLREATRVEVKELGARPGGDVALPTPAVQAHIAANLEEEAAIAVEWLRDHQRQVASLHPDREPTLAVLCRRRAQFGPIVDALRVAEVPYEVVGLGGLLDTPEVSDLVALLQVAHDPSRGDALMRLLTGARLNLGPGDLAALHDRAEVLAGPRGEREGGASIIDALSDLPREQDVSDRQRAMSDAARERLTALGHTVGQIRRHTYLPLTELVTFAERAWGLDVEVEVASPGGRARRTIDAFVNAVRGFAGSAEHATLGAMLAWLEAARSEESGLELPVKEPEPGTVQVLTVHAAKGLEWDVTVVPGMTDGKFPITKRTKGEYYDPAWLRGTALPWHLRMDSARLPEWHWRSVVDHASLTGSIDDFRHDAGLFSVEEERRLFYVAVTRARHHVLLSGSWFVEGVTLQKVSPFLEELLEAGVADRGLWAERPEDGTRPDEKVHHPVPWPRPATAAQQARRVLADAVARSALEVSGASGWDESLPFGREVAAMLAERAARGAATVELPTHLSTSALVAIRRDREAFLDLVRRPMPQEPTSAAHRGSTLHAWIESHYGRVPLLEADDLGPDEEGDEDLAALKRTWEASEWADRTPSDVEVDVELPIAGRVIRSRIDAVFPAGRGLERVTVVDWKSGRPPADPAEKAAREVQLAVYRAAWAAWKGLRVEDVDAAFYYVATDETVRPDRLLTAPELEALVVG